MTSILVADDAPNVRKLLRLILEPTHQVIEAADGNEASRLLLDLRHDIVILDVSMPGRTGLDVCRELRRDERLAAIGVIVITANGTTYDEEAALTAGADHFVTKPFSPSTVLGLVESVRTARLALGS